MKLRTASIADAESIANIHTTSWRDTYKNALTQHYLINTAPQERKMIWLERLSKPAFNQHVIVAEDHHQIIGFACFYADHNPHWGTYLDNLHVHKTHQSKGIGKALLVKGAHWCFQKNPNSGLCLLVNQNNHKAQKFYKHLGAENAKHSTWNAPDGSSVPTYWFIWSTLNQLANRPTNN